MYIVTGANTGVGYAAAKALAAKNARVYMASRSRDKQQKSVDICLIEQCCIMILLYCMAVYCLIIFAVCHHARAVEDIKRELPNAQIDWLECDLGNLR